MHSRQFLFTALIVFVATSALAIPVSLLTEDSSHLQRRDPPAWSEDNIPHNPNDPETNAEGYPEAERRPDGNYRRTQKAANQCFEKEIQGLLNGHGDSYAEGYHVVMKMCEARHGKVPEVAPSTREKLDALAKIWRLKWGRGPKFGVLNAEKLTEREKEYVREDIAQDERTIEYMFGVPPQRQAGTSQSNPTGPNVNGGSSRTGVNNNGNDGMNAFSAHLKAFQDRLVNGLSRLHLPPSDANQFRTFRPGPLLGGEGGMLLRPL